MSRFVLFRPLSWLVLSLFLLPLPLAAQTSRGTVSGLVTDATGAVIPGAAVTLTSNQTGVIRTTVTNGEGLYRFDAVELGNYAVKLTAANFATIIKNNVDVSANQIAQVDASLSPGTQELAVDVSAESGALLQTEAPVRGGNIQSQVITQLPIGNRNPVGLALTLPGVSSNRGGFGVGTFSVNGGRGRSNNFLIDGTENNDISVAGQGFQITNPDAVAEVSIQTSNYDAEFGRAGGAGVNTITKAGTNQFHGTLAYQLDSTRDDAITSSQSRDTNITTRGRPPFGMQNVYSGTVGGPLSKNRTFFFGAYQEDRLRFNGQVQLITPTAAGRTALRTLFPTGASANVDLLLNLTQNAVGSASPFNLALGTVNGVNRGNLEFGTYFRNLARTVNTRQWQTRIDHKLGENDQLSGRFLSNTSDNPRGGQARFEGYDADSLSRLYNLLLTETHVFSPSLTNEARIAYNRLQFFFPVSDPNGPAGKQPQINVASISFLGVAPTFPQGRTANNYTLQDTVTWVRGDHMWRGGVDVLRQISTQAAPYNPRGTLTYAASTGFTAFANFVDNVGGANGNANLDFGSAIYHPSLFRTAAFVQDRWRVNSALTLTLGVRYENFGTSFNTLKTPAFTGLFNVDPVTRTGPFSQPNQVKADNNNFAPTLGIAYSPSFTNGWLGKLFGENKTVIRTGYQIGYDSFFNNIASNAAASSPNLVSTQTVSIVSATAPRGLANLSSQFPTVAHTLLPSDAQTLITPNLVNPYFQRWSLGVQRELPLSFLVDVSYVGSKGTKLYVTEDYNPQVRPELRVTPANFTGTPTGRYDNMQGGRGIRTNGASSSYHGGQLNVVRRFKHNLSLSAAYTFARLIDNASEVFANGDGAAAVAGFAVPGLFGGERNDRGLSLFDRTHIAAFTWVYELPFQREQRGWLGRVAGGWQLSGVTRFESGAPFTVLNGFDADGIGGANDRPTFNPNGQKGVRAMPVVDATGRITGYTNPDAGNASIDPATARYIINPVYTAGLANSVPRVGNLGRNTERSPRTNNWDLNILKRTRVKENKTLEFRAELFNAFNHPQYTQGSISPFSPGGGFVGNNAGTEVSGRFLNANTALSDGGGRVVRFFVRLVF